MKKIIIVVAIILSLSLAIKSIFEAQKKLEVAVKNVDLAKSYKDKDFLSNCASEGSHEQTGEEKSVDADQIDSLIRKTIPVCRRAYATITADLVKTAAEAVYIPVRAVAPYEALKKILEEPEKDFNCQQHLQAVVDICPNAIQPYIELENVTEE
ncbi:MAG: hypothetical protein GY845_18010 [Planctomycetes bacterium]|nr:hypothetical protein [Aestuariibacter sp.]MCP4610608.1 hypothetical protein [Planctomycetota bacterium]